MTVPPAGKSATAAGWYGKLPVVGDFASRRLDADFVKIWDEWLSSGLARLAELNRDTWLDEYLSSPPWRFFLTPGFLPAPMSQQTWTGVVIPSVDRVGRYYPLTLACKLENVFLEPGTQTALWSWLHQLEDLAVDAMQDDWSIDTLEAELERLGMPRVQTPVQTQEPRALSSDVFFESCTAPDSEQYLPGCFWYGETGLLHSRLIHSSAIDGSVMFLWSGNQSE